MENRLMEELGEIACAPLPFPLQHALIQTIAAPASSQEREDLMTLWAGQSVGLCHHTQAGELMAELIAKANVFFPNMPIHLKTVE
jgi:nitronate monooxygenase